MNLKNIHVAAPLLLLLCLFPGSGARAQEMRYVASYLEAVTIQPERAARSGLRLRIETTGAYEPLSLTRLRWKKGTGKSGAIAVHYTGSDSSFSEGTPFGTEEEKAERSGGQALRPGSNYFWITSGENSSSVPLPEAGVLSFDLGIQQYRPVWADEFSADTINRQNWKFEEGFVRNNELQWYGEENATCANGILTIEARREQKPNPSFMEGSTDWRRKRPFAAYTSSSLLTSGKQEWLYGRFELRARIDTAVGYWPAWWTLGVKNRWPSNGEIDIMEYYRGELLANYAVGTSVPYRAHWFTVKKPVRSFGDPGWKDRFHTWRMDWDSTGISIFLDGELLNHQPQSKLYNRDSSGFYPFRQKHYMLLNLAIGGDNGGDPSGTLFPLKYEVDYVRVGQKEEGRYKKAGTYRPRLIKAATSSGR